MGEAEKSEPVVPVVLSDDTDSDSEHDPQFEPLMHLPIVDTKTLEEDEEEIWKHRAQLYRYDDSETPGQWKQRGTGVVKLLKHKELGYVRLLMRRDTTLKVCANHYILPYFELRPHDKADRAWVWRTPSDFADEEQKPETLAIRFKDLGTFQDFHTWFEKAKEFMKEYTEKMKIVDEKSKGDGIKKEESDGEKRDEKEEAESESELSKGVEALIVA